MKTNFSFIVLLSLLAVYSNTAVAQLQCDKLFSSIRSLKLHERALVQELRGRSIQLGLAMLQGHSVRELIAAKDTLKDAIVSLEKGESGITRETFKLSLIERSREPNLRDEERDAITMIEKWIDGGLRNFAVIPRTGQYHMTNSSNNGLERITQFNKVIKTDSTFEEADFTAWLNSYDSTLTLLKGKTVTGISVSPDTMEITEFRGILKSAEAKFTKKQRPEGTQLTSEVQITVEIKGHNIVIPLYNGTSSAFVKTMETPQKGQ